MKLLIVIVGIATLNGCASVTDFETTNAKLKTMEEQQIGMKSHLEQVESKVNAQQALDEKRFCYSAGNAYSEGSIYAGLICQRESSMNVMVNGKRYINSLVWQKWIYNNNK